ncbi:ABC transporter transmembrane region [Beutenbergia cavernae DSM 12333]|uniref:ABC transporter transmembrane region n=1 Tax=Beutenbergia cavernae (strain ATCC BAA-8 / DSM 12333 / CCUG 43141 / JCM 11478 / NBRC 16432 / NCIMB 13614 / HKI 0122) TaxID=471853 RepID=C5BVW2_BEUC1|nr:ABC transporter ATP-binding protein [Beutenbergia cavernae]ACQ80563.1 ABC transporter transmembrane region [Beutenbergia cavernae DSM 12333]
MLLRLLGTYLAPYRRPIALVLVLQLVQTLASLYLPSLNARIIDDGVAVGDTAEIWRLGAVMLVVSLAQVVASVVAVYYGARTAMAVGRDVRGSLFARVQAFSAQEMGRFGAPSLITRTTNDVQQVQMLVMFTLTLIVMAPIMLVGGVIMALQENVALSAILLVVVPVLVLVVLAIVSRMVPLFQKMQKRIDAINGVMREQITGIRVIRAFVREGYEEERYSDANEALRDVSVRVGKLMALMFPTVMLVMNVTSVAVLWFGGQRIDSGAMELGALTAFLTYIMYILMAVMMSSMMVMLAPRAEVSAGRINEVLDSEPTILDPERPQRPEQLTGRLEFRDVTFGYPGADSPVLHGVSFVAEPGQTTAIIGATGSGKSTLVGLVPRLFDATSGQVLIDDVDVRDLDPAVVTAEIGLVPQKAYLFSGTVGSNLRYGDAGATDEALWDALGVAQGADFVREMDGGLDAEIAQGGTNVSGGQRQRLSIARALVHRPHIYLFDDSFSALDYATDAALRRALVPRTRDAVVLVVAQRVATIRDADRIIVLDDGRVVGQGTHDGLLETSETYREIVSSQLSLEEAA